MNGIIESLLKQRGITSPEEIEEFLSDKPRRTYDPFLMKNMREGVDLILSEIRQGRKICIYGDYDGDGVTSLCILHRALSCLTDQLTWYVPSRFTEGYGLNCEALSRLHEDGVGLVITVDCGITSVEEAAHAKSLGMKMLVTDHHSPGEKLPDCLIIDPKQEGETYPFRLLAGCGVAYKLVQALQRSCDQIPRSVIAESLDLVGAGTVGDIVSLTDENRTIVKYGLRQINSRRRPALKALIDAISLKEVTSENISFGIIPHINAAGRMGSAADAVKLFLAEDEETIRQQVDQLIAYNRERKSVQEDAWKRCEEQISGEEQFIILRVEDVHEGIAGIAAGKIKEAHYRPVILATPVGEGRVKGTGRSIPGVDIHGLLSRHREMFLKFGGHAGACGFTMEEEKFPDLKKALSEDAAELFARSPQLLQPKEEWDQELDPGQATLELCGELEKLQPCGEGNPAPRFLLRNVRIRWPKYMGSDHQHVRFRAEKGENSLACILFQRAGELKDLLEGDRPVNLIGSLGKNIWNNNVSVQFTVEEMNIGTEN